MLATDGPRGLTRAPQEKERVTKRAARFARRPLVMFLSLLLFFCSFPVHFVGLIPSSNS